MNKIIAILSFAAVSCGGSQLDISQREAGEQVASFALGEGEQNSSRIFVLGSGTWSKYVYHGYTSESFWVDLSIANEGPAKEVGILWTLDGWATSRRSLAAYKETLPNGRERWGLDVTDFATAGPQGKPSVEFAAFVTMQGATSWSPFRNHFIYDAVTPQTPVRLMRSAITWSGGVARLEGETRSLRTQAPRTVVVRYTLDGWKTSNDVKAVPSGQEHGFSVPLAIDPRVTEEVQFAVRVESAGQTGWDNAGGKNYSHRLAPSIEMALQDVVLSAPFDGILNLNGVARTAFPVGEVQVRVDSGAWTSLTALTGTAGGSGFGASGGFRSVTSTVGLARGAHKLGVRVTAGPYVREASLGFSVANAIAPASTIVLPASVSSVWDVDRSKNGTLYVAGDQGVARLDGSSFAATPFESAQLPGYYLDVEVTDAFVFGLNNQSVVVKWNQASGAVDRSFGSNGSLSLSEKSFGGLPVCFASSFAATSSALVVADSCNSRVLRLSFDGAFLDELRLGTQFDWSNVTQPVVEGNRVWVVRAGSNGVYELVAASLTGAMVEVERVKLDVGQSVDGFAVTSDGFWLTTGADLRRYTRGGAKTAQWVGGNLYDVKLPGVLSIAHAVDVLSDGTIEVLSVQTGRLERFRPLTP